MPGDDDTGTGEINEKSQSTKSSKIHSLRDTQKESIMDTVASPTEILESTEFKKICYSAIVNNKQNIIVSIVSNYNTADYRNYSNCFPRTLAR